MIDYKLEYFCEYDKYPTQSYCAIHGVDADLNLGDITKVDETKLPPITMICGGSPCQDFSVAGKQKGSVWTCKDCGEEYNPLTVHYIKRDKCPHCGSKNLEKTRSSLLVEWLRIIRANKPNFGIYENVKNIVGKEFKETTFKLFETELQEYGYNTYWKVLNAKKYGIPQNRERVYLILIKKELDNGKFKYPEGFDSGLRLKDILEEKVDEKYYISNNKLNMILSDKSLEEKLQINNNEVETVGLVDGTNFNQNKAVYNPNCISATIIGQGHCGNEPKIIQKQGDRGTNKYSVSDSSYTIPANPMSDRGQLLVEPTIQVKQATKQGYIDCKIGGVADLSYPDSNTRRGRVQDNGDICPTITATETGVCYIEPITKLESKNEFGRMGKQAVETFNEKHPNYGNTINPFNKTVDDSNNCPTITTRPEGFKTAILPITYDYRVRKLTPLECWRLMGFSDDDFYKAKNAGLSDSQLYKQAGNSIVVNVLYAILLELYTTMPYLFDDLRLGSYFSGIGAFEKALDMLYKYINSIEVIKDDIDRNLHSKCRTCQNLYSSYEGDVCEDFDMYKENI